ncbi:MAG: nucleoside kinase [Lachnospiraceae bacterium]|nr:nucleoside kinase [Lachnospiraceae bacterium]MCI9149362.1 nucleoside kinase [Lachnospiraceae bacterium]
MTYQVKIQDEIRKYPEHTLFLQVARQFQDQYADDIVLVMYNGRLRELNREITEDGELSFVTTADNAGRKAYRRSVTLLMQRAVYNLAREAGVHTSVRVEHSIGQAYYCELMGDTQVTESYLEQLGEEMRRIASEAWPIAKNSIQTDEAVKLFAEHGMRDKEKLFKYRRSSRVNIYSIGNYVDYYYGYMVPDTGYLNYFDLKLYDEGFVLCFPGKDTHQVEEFKPYNKLFHVLKESSKWSAMLEVNTVGALNDAIARGGIRDVILVQEALMERKIGEIAQQIATNADKKFVMIAGPTSSGKTSFSHRLSIQLMAQGLHPHPIALDDYYVNRVDTPRDEKGEYDFECLEAIDIELFNHDMTALMNGETVEMPTYNFKTGKREYRGNRKTLGKQDILVLEGIHGLNDKLSYSLPGSSKTKIYISALTQLNIDEHNNLPTTDGRLIRRMVRDARTRNITARETFARWDSVRRGEERHIFPFQEEADIMFNSALVYEIAVLKTYAEPLLFHIGQDCPEYMEAKRMLKFLDYFLPVPSDDVAKNSILREFIGGSCFNV